MKQTPNEYLAKFCDFLESINTLSYDFTIEGATGYWDIHIKKRSNNET